MSWQAFGEFVDSHPWVTFGMFLVAMQLAYTPYYMFGRRKSKRGDA